MRLREKIAILSNTILKMVVSIQEKVQYSSEFDRGHWDRAIDWDDNLAAVNRQKLAAIARSICFLRCIAGSRGKQIGPDGFLTSTQN